MLKAVLFDIDNTLLSFDEYVKQTMKCGFEKFGLLPYEDEMFSTFCRINNGLWRSIECGELDFDGLQKKRWNLIFAQLGISFDGPTFEKYFRGCLNQSAIPENGAMELLGYLRGKYLLGVASNGPYAQQVNRLKICGMLPYFAYLFISEEVGRSKPSLSFFTTCIERINEKTRPEIQPNEIMIVGDSLTSDMAGGRNIGMQTCLYNPQKKPVPDRSEIDFEIFSLTQMKKLI